jgi:hypothetical protein
MALAWKASWVQALRGSNPLSSALAKNTPLMECFLFAQDNGDLGGVRANSANDGSPILRH